MKPLLSPPLFVEYLHVSGKRIQSPVFGLESFAVPKPGVLAGQAPQVDLRTVALVLTPNEFEDDPDHCLLVWLDVGECAVIINRLDTQKGAEDPVTRLWPRDL